MPTLDQLARDLTGLPPSSRVMVLTGAGISVASGISTFRGPEPDAVWSRDVTEVATYGFFRRDPVASWRWYLGRFRGLAAALPNPAHLALVDIQSTLAAAGVDVAVLTQNIDGLHRRCGTRELIEVHGRADRVRCARVGCDHGAPGGSLDVPWAALEAFEQAPSAAALPRCPACDDLLRPHVLWFDERYDEHHDYGLDRVEALFEHLDLVIAVGTSFSVGITSMVLGQAGWLGLPVWSIDPHGAAPAGVRQLPLPAEAALPALAAALAVPR